MSQDSPRWPRFSPSLFYNGPICSKDGFKMANDVQDVSELPKSASRIPAQATSDTSLSGCRPQKVYGADDLDDLAV